jgi:hypothetical protein
MRKYVFHLLTALVIALVSCGPTLHVNSDYDKQANFSQYKTFAIDKNDTINGAISQFNRQRIINAIRDEMTKKGFQENSSSPDLFVFSAAIFKDMQAVTANTNYYGYGGMYHPYYWGGGMTSSNTTYSVQNYKDGSLIIDVVDVKTQKIVWEGVGNKEIDKPSKDPESAIKQAVASIMASFPPGGKKSK